VSLEEIKSEVTGLSEQQQDQLAAYLVHLRHQRDAAIRKEITARNDNRDAEAWVSLDELKEKWKD
jgi:hypothetical protein